MSWGCFLPTRLVSLGITLLWAFRERVAAMNEDKQPWIGWASGLWRERGDEMMIEAGRALCGYIGSYHCINRRHGVEHSLFSHQPGLRMVRVDLGITTTRSPWKA